MDEKRGLTIGWVGTTMGKGGSGEWKNNDGSCIQIYYILISTKTLKSTKEDNKFHIKTIFNSTHDT